MIAGIEYGKCRRCGAYRHLTKHHILPKRDGGKDDNNIIKICKECHTNIHKNESKNNKKGWVKLRDACLKGGKK